MSLATSAPAHLDETLLVLGLLLVGGALVSGLAHRSFLSLTAGYVVAGFVLGEGGFEVLDFDPTGGFVATLATIALIVILFRDGLEVEAEMIQEHWRPPARKLVFAMPLTAGLIAVAAHVLTDLDWTESFLLGALLSPTDPVLSSSVVTNPRVPRLVRHSLNLESGLNDGLALPAVLALLASLAATDDFTWWTFVVQDIGVGLATGIAVGWLASVLFPRQDLFGGEIPPHHKALFALGVGFSAYALAVLPPDGNGFIAVFVCAIVLGIRRPDVRVCFEARSEDIIELVKLSVFVVFGSLLTFGGLFDDGLAAVAIVLFTLLVARPVAVFASLIGTKIDIPTRGFMAWFGPKGVATMTFSLLVLSEGISAGNDIFNLAALVVFTSIIAHGLTDTPGAEWLARRAELRDGNSRVVKVAGKDAGSG
jgi:NhaP-type Na+/H+ or K+/H+ antiporter